MVQSPHDSVLREPSVRQHHHLPRLVLLLVKVASSRSAATSTSVLLTMLYLFKGRAGFVPADFHRDAFDDAAPYHVPDAISAQVVEQQSAESGYVARRFLGASAIDYGAAGIVEYVRKSGRRGVAAYFDDLE